MKSAGASRRAPAVRVDRNDRSRVRRHEYGTAQSREGRLRAERRMQRAARSVSVGFGRGTLVGGMSFQRLGLGASEQPDRRRGSGSESGFDDAPTGGNRGHRASDSAPGKAARIP